MADKKEWYGPGQDTGTPDPAAALPTPGPRAHSPVLDYTPKQARNLDPEERAAWWFDGSINSQGQILNAYNNRQLVMGKAADVSPQYYRYLTDSADWAQQYAHADPRTWVPLVKQAIKASDTSALPAVTADSISQSAAGLTGVPAGGEATAGAAAGVDTNSPDTQAALSDLQSKLTPQQQQVFSAAGIDAQKLIDSGTVGLTPEQASVVQSSGAFQQGPNNETGPMKWLDKEIGGPVSRVWDSSGADSAFRWSHIGDLATSGPVKATSRMAFSAMQMPQQYIVSYGANVYGALANHEWRVALLKATLGTNPALEQAATFAGDVSGHPDFYRGSSDSGQPQGTTVLAGTDFGQVLMDWAGTGKQQQFLGADVAPDAAGFSGVETGTGFFMTRNPQVINDPNSDNVAALQSKARISAHEIAPEAAWSAQQAKEYRLIATQQDPAAAAQWAQSQGLYLNPKGEWVHPAQGFTFGRAIAINVFHDPYSQAFRNWSGFLDFGENIVGDPMTYIPGGQVKDLASLIRGGGLLAKGSEGLKLVDQTGKEVLAAGDVVDIQRAAANAARGPALRAARKEGLTGDAYVAAGETAARQAAMKASEELVANGHFLMPTRAWEFFTTGKGRSIVQKLTSMNDAYEISRQSGGKIPAALADQLSKTTTDAETLAAMAPSLGVKLRYQNDLVGFADLSAIGITNPTHYLSTAYAKATDLARLQQAWIKHVPGQAFLPPHDFPMGNPDMGVEAMTRWADSVDRNLTSDPVFHDAMNRYIEQASGGGLASRQGEFASVYGAEGEHALYTADGKMVGTASELRQQFGKEWVDRLIEQGRYVTKPLGHDGVLTTIAKYMAKSRGLSEVEAKAYVRAFREDDEMYRLYAQDGRGHNAVSSWDHEDMSGPMLETDVMDGNMPLPDVRAMKAALTPPAKMARYLADRNILFDALGRGARFYKWSMDNLESLTHKWKSWTLLAGGVRLGIYIFRTVFDTAFTAALAGGRSMMNRPLDVLSLAMVGPMRRAAAGLTEEERLGLRLGQMRSGLYGLLHRDILDTDATGKTWDEGIEMVKNGEGDGHDYLYRSTNRSQARRGSMGVDENYAQASRYLVPHELRNNTQAEGYVHGVAGELHRLAGDSMARALAGNKKDFEEIAKTFFYGTSDRSAAVKQFPNLRDQLSSLEGVRAYLHDIEAQIDLWTGGDPALRRLIATGHFDGNPIMADVVKNGVKTGDREFQKSLVDYLHARREAQLDGQAAYPLPQTVVSRPMPGDPREPHSFGQRKQFDGYTNKLFHMSGVAEDYLARDPFFKGKYWKHVLDSADMMSAHERELMAASVEAGSPRLARKLRAISGDGVVTRAEMHDVAGFRAFQEVRDIAYDAGRRRNWAYALRILQPFAQAIVNGMYRWVKHAIQNPESTYRLMKKAWFLTGPDSAFISDWDGSDSRGKPFLYPDPESGQTQFAIPLGGLLLDNFARAVDKVWPGGGGVLPSGPNAWNVGVSNLNQAFPMYEESQHLVDQGVISKQAGFMRTVIPGLGPVVTAPLDLMGVADNLGVMGDYLFPYGPSSGSAVNRVVTDLAPRQLQNLANAWFPSGDQQARSAGNTALIVGEMINKDPSIALDKTKFQAAWTQAVAYTNSLNLVKAMAGVVIPGSVSVSTLYTDPNNASDYMLGAQALAKIWQDDYLKPGVSYDQAEARFIREFGLGALAVITPSGDNTDAAPPNYSSATLKRDDPAAYSKYKTILNWLPQQHDQFDQTLYNEQLDTGERNVFTLEQRANAIQQKILDQLYFSRSTAISEANVDPLAKMHAMVELKDTLHGMGWDEVGPSGKDTTNSIALLAQAARDPSMRDYIGPQTSKIITAYLLVRQNAISSLQDKGLAGDLSGAKVSGAPERDKLFAWGELMSQVDPGWSYIWFRSPLRNEVVTVPATAPAQAVPVGSP